MDTGLNRVTGRQGVQMHTRAVDGKADGGISICATVAKWIIVSVVAVGVLGMLCMPRAPVWAWLLPMAGPLTPFMIGAPYDSLGIMLALGLLGGGWLLEQSTPARRKAPLAWGRTGYTLWVLIGVFETYRWAS